MSPGDKKFPVYLLTLLFIKWVVEDIEERYSVSELDKKEVIQPYIQRRIRHHRMYRPIHLIGLIPVYSMCFIAGKTSHIENKTERIIKARQLTYTYLNKCLDPLVPPIDKLLPDPLEKPILD